MRRRGTQLDDRRHMRRRDVALMHREPVAGVFHVQPSHQPVTRLLGDDRGRRDRSRRLISAHHRPRRHPDILELEPVHQVRRPVHQVRRPVHSHRLKRAAKRAHVRHMQPVPVDLTGRDDHGYDHVRHLEHDRQERRPPPRRQLLGIVQIRQPRLRVRVQPLIVEPDSGGDQRSGHAGTPRLIRAAHIPDALTTVKRKQGIAHLAPGKVNEHAGQVGLPVAIKCHTAAQTIVSVTLLPVPE